MRCDRLTFDQLNAAFREHIKQHPTAGFSKARHGTWVRHRESEIVGRIAYDIDDGPVVVLWGATPEKSIADPRWGLCDPKQVEILRDRAPTPWYGQNERTVPSINALLDEAGLRWSGVVAWKEPVPLDEPGVYLVSLTNEPDAANAALSAAPIGDGALGLLLRRCSDLRIHGQRPTLDELRGRIASFWVLDQSVLYVGKAGTSLKQRVGQYYTTRLGARSPHAGGWWLKLLANLDDLFIHCTASDTPEESERLILQAFMASVPRDTRVQLPDPNLPLPFANLQLRSGVVKPHGITGATDC